MLTNAQLTYFNVHGNGDAKTATNNIEKNGVADHQNGKSPRLFLFFNR